MVDVSRIPQRTVAMRPLPGAAVYKLPNMMMLASKKSAQHNNDMMSGHNDGTNNSETNLLANNVSKNEFFNENQIL